MNYYNYYNHGYSYKLTEKVSIFTLRAIQGVFTLKKYFDWFYLPKTLILFSIEI